jgi:hypothetical protein
MYDSLPFPAGLLPQTDRVQACDRAETTNGQALFMSQAKSSYVSSISGHDLGEARGEAMAG